MSGDIDKFSTLGDLLHYLRRQVGLTQLDLAKQVGYSGAQISRLEQNLRLVDLPTLQRRFAPALGIDNQPAAMRRLMELAALPRHQSAPAPGRSPYMGLRYFDEADSGLFFGREALTVRLFNIIQAQLASRQGPQFLAIVGASGSGKSSVVRAGLVPTLRTIPGMQGWPVQILTPTAHPLEALASLFIGGSTELADASALAFHLARDSRTLSEVVQRLVPDRRNVSDVDLEGPVAGCPVLIVDQFEELFSLCQVESERQAFVANLADAAGLNASVDQPPAAFVIIALRADYYANCAPYAALRHAMSKCQEYIGSMTVDELRRAIEAPATKRQWELELGLVEVLLHDIGATAGRLPEPGALPLLSHALREVWNRRRGRALTMSGYLACGGINGAIAETADGVYQDELDVQEQAVARNIFLRLTALADGDNVEGTRRRVSFNELAMVPHDWALVRTVLTKLADARLITLDNQVVEVAHEALIREWPTLRNWLEIDREDFLLHRRLTSASNEWVRNQYNDDELYRGDRLAQALEWAARPKNADRLNETEHKFLRASQARRERLEAEQQAQRQREFEIRKAAEANLIRAESLRLAGEADRILNQNDGNAELAALLAIRALRMTFTLEADIVLGRAVPCLFTQQCFAGHTGTVSGVAFSPDGHHIVTASADLTVRIWETYSGQEVRQFLGHTDQVRKVAVSADGRLVATGGADGTARLWDFQTGMERRRFTGHHAAVSCIAISADGSRLLTGGEETTAYMWDTATGMVVNTLAGHTGEIRAVAFSSDGLYALTGSLDHTAMLWDAKTGKALRPFEGHTSWVSDVAFSPDGRHVLTAGWDNTARMWDTLTGQLEIQFLGHASWLNSVAFSADGSLILTSSGDGTARLWDARMGKELRRLTGQTETVTEAVFSPNGEYVLTGSRDRVPRLWNAKISRQDHLFLGHSNCISAVTVSANGAHVLTGSWDRTACLWDAETADPIVQFVGHTDEVWSVDLSGDGRLVVTGSADRTARLWDVHTGRELVRLGDHSDAVTSVAFSSSSDVIVTASADRTAHLWEAPTGREMRQFLGHADVVYSVAFSPDGRFVVTASYDRSARLWDLETGKELRRFLGHTAELHAVAISPDGNQLVTGSRDRTTRVWNLFTGKEIAQLTSHTGSVVSLAFSADGRYLLSGSTDNTAIIWECSTWRPVRRFGGHTGQVAGVAFWPDSSKALTGSGDATARWWSIDLQTALRSACRKTFRDLTAEERSRYAISDLQPACEDR